MDGRQVAGNERRVPLAQPNLVDAECDFEPIATGVEFSSCLRHASRFAQIAPDLNPAIPWLLPIYPADLETYAAVSEVYEEREIV